MSAPNTNVEKQKGRHKGPLVGMAVVLAFAAILFVTFFGYVWEPAADASAGTASQTTTQ